VIYELLALSEVLKAVQSTGTEVRYYGESCQQGAAGSYQLNQTVDRLVICPSNQVNHSDLFDTIRHEAIHVVQACNGWDNLKPASFYSKYMTQEVRDTLTEYPQDSVTQRLETEAFLLAENLNEKQVIGLINKYCFE